MLEEYHDRALLYALSGRPLEQNYPLAASELYEAVQSAIFEVVSRLHPGLPLRHRSVDGRSVYLLRSRDNILAQLFTLRLSSTLVSLRMTPLMPLDPIQLILARQRPLSEDAKLYFDYVFGTCHEAVITFVRTAASAQGFDPPPPPRSNVEDIITWGAMYYPELSDKELAEMTHVGYQTIRNVRSSTGQLKRKTTEFNRR